MASPRSSYDKTRAIPEAEAIGFQLMLGQF
jgi:hypothetical protein